jgi:exopolysaccharide biosynthesis predicted pyruvyltransferase EpsI
MMPKPHVVPSGPHVSLIAARARIIEGLLEPLLPRGDRIALVDFPQTANVGDSLIWLGALAYLRKSGRGEPAYTCTNLTYDASSLARQVGRGTILLSGGGNLGDLYEQHQKLRERVIADFPDRRIIQLPQSIHFEFPDALARARTVFDRHPNLTLLVRDETSLAIARKSFRAPSQLCPDMSFCLGPLLRPQPPDVDVVWLSRSDKESAGSTPVETPAGVRRVDWVHDDAVPVVRFNRFLTRHLRRRPALRPWLVPMLVPTFDALASHRLIRGCRTLGAGKIVVTNRLHGHILCTLLGIRHYLVDNSYGKVRGFHDAWTRESDLAQFCESEREALRLALAEAGHAATS